MIEVLLSLIGVLLAITIGASFEYYRHVRKAQREYEKARDTVQDIVLSFNRELKREADNTELVSYKVEGNIAKVNESLKKVETSEHKLGFIEAKMISLSERDQNIPLKVTKIEMKTQTIEAAQQTLKTRITELETEIQKLVEVPEMKSIPVIPIRREKAMAALTDTEVIVLEMLSAEGPKTAPEIKDRVRLSREHTSRLMKKLYEKGYLERETGKIPFSYRIKEEMKKLLKKAESEQI